MTVNDRLTPQHHFDQPTFICHHCQVILFVIFVSKIKLSIVIQVLHKVVNGKHCLDFWKTSITQSNYFPPPPDLTSTSNSKTNTKTIQRHIRRQTQKHIQRHTKLQIQRRIDQSDKLLTFPIRSAINHIINKINCKQKHHRWDGFVYGGAWTSYITDWQH